MRLMVWNLAQPKTGYSALLPEFPTILPLFPGPQLTLQGKNCQMWTSFLSHCTRTYQLSMQSRTTDTWTHSVQMLITQGVWQYNRWRSTRPPTSNPLWHKNRHWHLGWICQKKQGIPENMSHGDPLEDSKCRTKWSMIQTSSKTWSNPPPHPLKTSPMNCMIENRTYWATYQTRQCTLKTIL